MKITNMNKILDNALKGNYAVPAFNIYNIETAKAVLKVCEEEKRDVILAVSESAGKYAGGFKVISSIVNNLVYNLHINVALHLDHGSSFEVCKEAIDCGFSSVMIDASSLKFEDNIILTQKVVSYARSQKSKISVEAELGELVGVEDDKFGSEQVYTDPNKAKEFVKKTHVDALAISIGTSHGINKGVGTPKIRFDIVRNVQEQLPYTPLVCHGASMVRDDIVNKINNLGGNIIKAQGIDTKDIHNLATNTNICKINMDTDLRLAFTLGVKKYLTEHTDTFDPRKYLNEGMKEIENQVKFTLNLLK